MITEENKHKLPRRNGDKALAKLVGNAPPAAQPASAERLTFAAPPPEPRTLFDGVTVGVQGRDGFRAMNNMSILHIPREYRRRFAVGGAQLLRETAFALRAIMQCRMQGDFPDCAFTVDVVQPAGDLCVSMEEGEGSAYLADSRVLQTRLDDACARFAGCLGV